jgi:hypothetical protein
MKRKLLSLNIPIILLSLLALTACEEEENIIYPEVDPFDKLVVAQNVTVKLMNGTPDLSIRGRGDLSGVQLQVSDQLLTVALPNPATAQNVVVEIFHNDMVSVNSTQNSRISLASDFTTSSQTLILSAFNNSAIYSYYTLSVDTLDIRLSDEAFVGLSQVDVSKNSLSMYGNTLCFLEGNASDQFIDITDDCSYNVEDRESGWAFSGPLEAENVWVTARNGAMAWVQATNYLNATGTTGSMVYYKGDPVTIEENMTNGAELIQKNQ